MEAEPRVNGDYAVEEETHDDEGDAVQEEPRDDGGEALE